MAEKISKPTAEQIKKWKELYGKVHEIEVPEKYITADGREFDEEDEANDHAAEMVEGKRTVKTVSAKCWLKTPSRKVIDMATTIAGKSPMKFGEVILKNCWLGGDERIQTDDELFMAANGILGEIIKIKTAKIKNC